MHPYAVLEALVLATVLIGLVALLRHRNLWMKLLGMDVMGTGVIALFVLVAARGGLRTPILPPGSLLADPAQRWADPIPQAVILTAIVIGFSVQALLLVATTRLARLDPSLDVESLDALAADPPAPRP
ncbi:NADH-quinone oxidoreductase subunit K [Vulcanococcus limneticus Candia 3F8]|uniref:NADH-quinone oxidoreductase subunit K n=1 Tax=Vulcanococcus limneticus TaxID=2170428 RepID=UPI0018E3BB53|nr:NADH-quinone oxidoreductase subunit K [Vulcanococcus limneticus]MCP9791224.1 NADH-quinone oxidoreductase subunit K [Vulcanococcus limneticus MW73D5]MCP9893546.1 NADH-quinone oxidoreductase subunit K [Vulcanococcus limneticus Candia 3F8]MCP9896622.1 NADH-quinone oxidoreductase subunit K [Vulcanococcus limneticus Candia 3B3]